MTPATRMVPMTPTRSMATCVPRCHVQRHRRGTTDLSLEAAMYDTSPSADYESWLLLEEAPQEEA